MGFCFVCISLMTMWAHLGGPEARGTTELHRTDKTLRRDMNRVWNQDACVQNPVLPLVDCVTFGKLLDLSVFQPSHL